MSKIKRLLVANRGEIAIRVMRTCREMGIETVAVHSDTDKAALHVQYADYSYSLGGTTAAESYLLIDKILEACRVTGADSVHPGYGFLSENPLFVEACEKAGILFVGPSADSMRVMGSKTDARAAVTKAGTPVVPGSNGPEGQGFPNAASALAAAKGIGFPVLIKAAAGGGGKGMRLVSEESDFSNAFDGAKREAKSSFGDDRVYVEKAIIKPRHIEIQVFADTQGNVIHLGERDCSIQRRHQKVVEEAPSVAVDDALREKMGKAAVAAATSCDYVGAGTVEFLLADNGEFYFLEMNTRLQVEHPVTEMIYGVDLVQWQIEVAEGKPLRYSQSEISQMRRGWALECRIYAEDSVRFMPSPGKILGLVEPGGPYVRNDCGVYEGGEVSVYYDPMISKLIVWADTRLGAIARMKRALHEYELVGIQTNISFHISLLSNQLFVDGQYDTGFLDREHPELLNAVLEQPGETAARAAVLLANKADNRPSIKFKQPQKASGWRNFSSWRQ